MARPDPHEPIAIIGSACRFPGGSDTPSKLWELLREPRDVLQEKIDRARRFDPSAFFHPDNNHHGTTNVQSSYLLDDDPANFDGGFFNISAAEIEAIDPQQRMLMETVYDSLCSAGHTIEGLRGSSTAVMVGLMGDDWSNLVYRDLEALPKYAATGVSRSVVSNRLSYCFDWRGPCMTIDTACSSSMVAVHLAIQALRNGESHMAVAAGANLLLSPAMYVAESNLQMLSPNGRSRMWDKNADGYARGEGIASVILKPLSAAIRDRDHIECIIRATGVNQDGKTPGLTMPSAAAQAALIRDTYARAGLDLSKPEDRPQFFHAHGTGTPAGDPQEAEAIAKAFYPRGAPEGEKLYVGSIKTIIGHTEGTAGLASLVGTSQALQNGMIPPNLHFAGLNPKIEPFYGGLEVPTVAKPWPELLPGQPRRASINSFGFGGTNAHAIVESYDNTLNASTTPQPGSLFTPITISAASENSLRDLLSSYIGYLRAHPEVPLQDFAHTLQERRSTLAHRAFITASTNEEAATKMTQLLAPERSDQLGTKHGSVTDPRLLGIFTGQGAQWPRMGAMLIEMSPFAASRLAELDSSLSSLPVDDRPATTLREELLADAASSRIAEAALSQPLCTAVQIVLVDLLRAAGIKFSAVVGHSSGEIAAAYAAGFITAHDAIRVAYYRGLYSKFALSPRGQPGAMMAVGASLEEAAEFCQQEAFNGKLQVAAYNSSSSVTISGDEDAVVEAVDTLKREGKFARRLKVSVAYHSAHMIPCAAPYLAALEAAVAIAPTESLAEDRPTWYSSVHGGRAMTADDLSPQYWVENLTGMVRFAPAVTAAATNGGPFDMALEVGPHPALKGPCLGTLEEAGNKIPYFGTLSRGGNDITYMAETLGFVWAKLGPRSVLFDAFEIAVSGTEPGARRFLPDLPKYPFDHSRPSWAMTRISGSYGASALAPPHPLLGKRQAEQETPLEIRWRNIFKLKELSWMSGHKLQDQIVVPAAAFVAMAVEAITAVAAGNGLSISLITLEDLSIDRGIAFDDDASNIEVVFSVSVNQRNDQSIRASFSCSSGPAHYAGKPLLLNARGTITAMFGEPDADQLPFVQKEDWNLTSIEVDRFYEQFDNLGYGYAQPFRGVRSIDRRTGYAIGTIENQCGSNWEDQQFLIHPGLLDTAFQTSSAAFTCPGDGRLWAVYIPARIKRLTINPHFSVAGGSQGSEIFPWESAVTSYKDARTTLDINLFSPDDAHTFVQIEGLELMPLTPGRPEDDTPLFTRFEYCVDQPNGELAASTDGALSAEDIEHAITAERVALYYLRRLLEAITPEEKASALPHYQQLLDWAERAVELVKSRRNASVPATYANDTKETISALLARNSQRADLRLLKTVGASLPDAVRSGSSIVEHMVQDDLPDFGRNAANGQLSCMVAQIGHRYPHANVLEIRAGKGESTGYVLNALGSAFSTYTYTDASEDSFEAAQERFREYSSRMVFRKYDIEQPPAAQGFTEGYYDVVFASGLLNGTAQPDEVISNARHLLKPGGYLITLERTSNDNLAAGLTMGSLPSWWAGTGPALSLSRWDELLVKSGFSGVDTDTPPTHRLNPYTVFAAQAVNERIELLRSPLESAPETPAPRLVILGGQTLAVQRAIRGLKALLRSRFEQIDVVNAVESLDDNTMIPGSSVLSVTELDEPVFAAISPVKLEGLKALWRSAGTVLWVTRRARTEEPLSFMSHGLCRVVKYEYPNVSLQVLDLDVLDAKTPELIAEEFIRTAALKKWAKEAKDSDILWSSEPEVSIESGKRLIPRLYKFAEANDRYKPARRTLMKSVDPLKTSVVLAALATAHPTNSGPHRRCAIELACNARVFLCVGIDQAAGNAVLAVTHTAESRPTIPAGWTVPLPSDADLEKAVAAVAAQLVASTILSLAQSGSAVLVHEPDVLVAAALTQQAAKTQIEVVITTATTTSNNNNNTWHHIHSKLSSRAIKKILPSHLSVFADLSQTAHAAPAGKLIAKCLPTACASFGAARFYGTTAQTPTWLAAESVAAALAGAWRGVQQQQGGGGGGWSAMEMERDGRPAVLSLRDVPARSVFGSPLAVGLCKWMIEHGARYVVLSSRRPKPLHPGFLGFAQSMGATVEVLPLDVTSKDAVFECHRQMAEILPPVGGVAMGAMVLDDSLFEGLSFEALTRVLEPKVAGTRNLDALFHTTPLDFFIVFSSLVCATGNSGQSNYVAANMYMAAVAQHRKRRGLAGSAISLGSVMGVGVVERTEGLTSEYFINLGTRNVSEQDVQQQFAEAIRVGHPDCDEAADIVAGLVPIYADTEAKAQYRDDPKFGHIIMHRAGASDKSGRPRVTLPVRVQLPEVKSRAEAMEVIKASFIFRLKRILMIAQSDAVHENLSLVEQGMDSLMAVEVRSWFLNEMEVDIPTLKILGGSTIGDLLVEAVGRMPVSIMDLSTLPSAGAGDSTKEAEVKPKPKPKPQSVTSPPPEVEDLRASVSSLTSSSSESTTPGDMSPSRSAELVRTPETQSTEPSTPVDTPSELSLHHEKPTLRTATSTEKERTVPISHSQRGFWFLQDDLKDKATFNMTVMFKLTGHMDVPRLERAVQTLGRRHEALRTRYFVSDEEGGRAVMQGILEGDSPVRLVHKRLAAESDAYDALNKMHSHEWDLGSWEAARIHLLTVDDNTHFLLAGGHHISWDGYSFSVLFVDLEAAYSGKPLGPLGPENQFWAATQAQIDLQKTGGMKSTLDELRGIIDPNRPPISLFPFAKSPTRPAVSEFAQFEAKATLPPGVVSKLRQVARTNRSTMFHLYLAAIQGLVLRLLPDTDDFFVGIADANRLDRRFIGSLGLFLNLLPVHFKRGGQGTRVSNLIQGARDAAYGALQRSSVPWGVVLDELKIPRVSGHSPVFQLFFNYNQVVHERSTFGGCKLSDESWLDAGTGYDFALGATDNPKGESRLSLRLSAGTYTQESTELLMRSFVNVLETFAAGIDCEAADLPAYAPRDIELGLEAGKGPETTLEWPLTLPHRIDQMVETHGSAPALKDGLGDDLTYEQMAYRVHVIAASLVAAGAGDGAVVGVFQTPSADWICSLLAIMRVGAIYVPLDLHSSMDRLATITRLAKPGFLLVNATTSSQTDGLNLPEAVKIVVSDLSGGEAKAYAVPNQAKPDSTALMLFTSGTSGQPKGVLLTHANLRAQVEGHSRACGLPSLVSVVLQQSIYSFDMSVDQTFTALAHGGCLVVVPADKRGDPESVTALMAEHGVTYTLATPAEYNTWFSYARDNLARCQAWQAALSGGEHLQRGLVGQFADLAREQVPGLRLFNAYGPTEVTAAATGGEVKHSDPELEYPISVGSVLPNYRMAVVDDRMQTMPVGVAGEICVGGPGVARGYLPSPGVTQDSFIPGANIHPSLAETGTWYRTGDLGVLRASGTVDIIGRISGDNQVKLRGFRVELQEVEAVLLTAANGALSHAIVTARGEGEGRFLAAHVVFGLEVPHDRRPGLTQRLESGLPLPSYMQPTVVIPIDNIPLTKHGKFDRAAIQALSLPAKPNPTTVAAAELTAEARMAALWRKVIPHGIQAALTPETGFFEAGGTSILLVKLRALIKTEFRYAPRLAELMNGNTLGGMAKVVESRMPPRALGGKAEVSGPAPPGLVVPPGSSADGGVADAEAGQLEN
ncbi:hypothetical protein CHGG_05358 [Chaetomium globosum CBS 148.51]|uniref:Carrier domain-containing protein n=1 Tax=Chaetomium globosum (strain ATCC 6205 / CBS 148.51 / DSM 1962 / NBRC 6347 / NRRL 1970) TaxID=306901 RepID=Q2H7K7_CHAGB|nr:uncharacterized protein CHGG_05358 [Chaetomium globosum CBS 148.51]EAQ88739.1 hypothetical protein CHGG_05358 [Chaetomium globosum CBS 148.51]